MALDALLESVRSDEVDDAQCEGLCLIVHTDQTRIVHNTESGKRVRHVTGQPCELTDLFLAKKSVSAAIASSSTFL